MNLVAVDPSADVLTELGLSVLSPNGNIFWVGEPFSICLIWTDTGKAVSLAPKYISTELTKIPPFLSTKNDCANGSTHLTCCLSSETSSVTILPFLVETISSWTTLICPSAE